MVNGQQKLQSDTLSMLAISQAGCLLLLSHLVLGFEFVGVFPGCMGEANSINWIIGFHHHLGLRATVCVLSVE